MFTSIAINIIKYRESKLSFIISQEKQIRIK